MGMGVRVDSAVTDAAEGTVIIRLEDNEEGTVLHPIIVASKISNPIDRKMILELKFFKSV